jgi:hypothetical protein
VTVSSKATQTRTARRAVAVAAAIAIEEAQVDAPLLGARPRGLRRGRRQVEGDRVEEGRVRGRQAPRRDRLRQQARHEARAQRDAGQAVGAVPDRVEGRHVRQQRLRGADVAGRLVAADVLLARLQRHAQRRPAGGVLRHADDAARHRAHERFARGHEGRVRAAGAQRHAEALRAADRHVGAHRARRAQQQQRQRVAADRGHAAGGVDRVDRGRQVAHAALGVGVLQVRAEQVGRPHPAGGQRRLRVVDHDLDAGPPRARGHHAITCGWQCASTRNFASGLPRTERRISVIASAAAVASSSSDALATGSPVRSITICWNASSASSRPCEISAWYGVYAVYQPGFSSTLRRIASGTSVPW